MSDIGNNPKKNKVFKASLPTEEDLFWLELARTNAKESIKAQEEAAKQLISMTTFSQTIYFAVVSFGEVKKSLFLFQITPQTLVIILLITPLVFWLFSLLFATRVFTPKPYKTNLSSPPDAREMYQRIIAYKQRQLNRAHLALVLGFVPLVLNIIVYLSYFPLAKDKTG